MNRALYLVFIFLFVLSSCELNKRENRRSTNLSQAVRNVIAGKDTTSKLSILRDRDLPPLDSPNSIAVDTFVAFGKKYYSVLAEYADPFYNRFAIIDSYDNVLLLDNSLNGYLTGTPVVIGRIKFVRVEENFLSKGILGLKRMSLYSMTDKGEAGLVFRTYTELREPGVTYRQDIGQITLDEIKTKIYSTSREGSKLYRDKDVFHFNEGTGRYTSRDDFFDTFVISEVKNYDVQSDKPEIISRESYLRLKGIKTSEAPTEHKLGHFSMPLTSEWNEVDNVTISTPLKKQMTGTRFINNHYGAEISVIQIPANDSSESFIDYPFENISSGNYRVRFTEKISGAKYYFQFFEYRCGSEKFLLILQTLKSTYDLYKSDYQALINSFSMDC